MRLAERATARTHLGGDFFQRRRVPAHVWHSSPICAFSETLLAARTPHERTVCLKVYIVLLAVVDDFVLLEMRV